MNKRFGLMARVSSSDPEAIRTVLKRLITKGTVKETTDEFLVEADREGADAKELNRAPLSALRKVEKTRLRAEWTSDDDTTQKFFDYVLKKTIKG
jgi:hypothetical protein